MKRLSLVAKIANVTFIILGVTSLALTHARAKQSGPSITAMKIAVGKKIFFDTTLSNPNGVACSTCHDPSTGFTNPNPLVNLILGPVPGAAFGRFGNRLPPSATYAALVPPGPPTFNPRAFAFTGGMFWDGRANGLTDQAQAPFLNPNEMNNLLHNVASPAMVVSAVQHAPYASQFTAIYGPNIFQQPTATVYADIADAIANYEQSSELSPFNSKYDAYVAGKATLTSDEVAGMAIFTGSARCSICHSVTPNIAGGPPIFTNAVFGNDGVPRNPFNPYYFETNQLLDPVGYNPLGFNFVDLGLGNTVYPTLGLPAGDLIDGDPLGIDGQFKTPSLRNLDKRPYPQFVKAYMHNGVFKSIEQVVHFYNTRNLTTVPGEVIDFTQPNPYANLQGTPLWPQPEYIPNMLNPTGSTAGFGPNIGNIGLTPTQEHQLVLFIKTLTDGFTPSGP